MYEIFTGFAGDRNLACGQRDLGCSVYDPQKQSSLCEMLILFLKLLLYFVIPFMKKMYYISQKYK